MTSSLPRVLVADDQPDIVAALRLLLRGEGFDADTASSIDEVRGRLSSQPYDLLLLDLNYARDTTSGREGLDLLAEVHARDDRLPIVVMTGWGTIDTAVEAMRRGARSFVHKPWDNATLTETVRREVADGIARREADIGARREREDAQRIQRALLPVTLPRLPWCEVAAAWMPASAFGGDCYDVIPLGGGRLGIAIADVAGKGLPAALLMSNLQATVRAFADVDESPADLATRTNRSLCRNGRVGRFVTFFYCVADAAARTLSFCNAGHNAPMLIRSDGSVERLAGGGMILGVFDDARYSQGEVEWREGDRLVLFTDGITEALPIRAARGDEGRVEDEDFGDERLVGVAAAARHLPPQGLVDDVVADVLRFAGPTLADDATVVCAAFSCATAQHTRPTTGHRTTGGTPPAAGNG